MPTFAYPQEFFNLLSIKMRIIWNSNFQFLKCGRKQNNYRFKTRLRSIVAHWMKLISTDIYIYIYILKDFKILVAENPVKAF